METKRRVTRLARVRKELETLRSQIMTVQDSTAAKREYEIAIICSNFQTAIETCIRMCDNTKEVEHGRAE